MPLLLIYFWVITFSALGNTLDNYFLLLKQLRFEEAKIVVMHFENPKEKRLLHYLADLMYNAGQQPVNEILVSTESDMEQALAYLTQGYRELYYTPNKSEAFKNFHASYKIANEIKYVPLIKATLIAIFEYYHTSILQNSQQFDIFIQAYKKYKLDEIDTVIIDLYSLIFLSQTLDTPNADYFELAKKLDRYLKVTPKASRLIPRMYYEKALSLEYKGKMDSASHYYNRVFESAMKYPFMQYLRFSTKIKLSEIEFKKKKYRKALDLVQEAKEHFDISDSVRSDLYIHRYSSQYYADLKLYDSAYMHLKKSSDAEYRLDFRKNTLEINRLNVVLQTQQKELENLNLRQNKIWLIVASSVLGLLLLLSYLAYNNIRSKKKIVEKEKEMQIQNMEKLLKEQELVSIDAMIEGQEKERQRIANELHDNLGSLLATVKYQFQNIREKKKGHNTGEDTLLDKTDELLEEAYQKVRSIAHIRNAGVHAQQGLLPAVKNFAAKVSISNKLNIDVIDHGMDERLENSLEITLFRTIQELITNIIKHSGADEAAIHLTHHENFINILVEDNGQGFDTSEIGPTVGMGLYSIQKRIENLKGKLTIESLMNKGTTVIIDIPLT